MIQPIAGNPHAVRRLGRPHFMYLRALLEGLPSGASAARFLAAHEPAEIRDAHHQAVDALRSIAQRHGTEKWELLAEGLGLRRSRAEPISLEVWAESKGVDPAEWSDAELLAMYHEDHPPTIEEVESAVAASQLRKARLELLRSLEAAEGTEAESGHAVEGWFDERTASRLRGAGFDTIGKLQTAIARGGRWYSAVDAIGPGKAGAIEAYLAVLLPALPEHRFAVTAPPAPADVVALPAAETSGAPPALADQAEALQPKIVATADASSSSAVQVPSRPGQVDATHLEVAATVLTPSMRDKLALEGLDGQLGNNRVRPGGLAARDDIDAAAAWLCARAGAPGSGAHVPATFSAYRKELRRLVLWCTGVRRVELSSMTSADCAAYIEFLANVPDDWISTARAATWSPLWRPFAGQLAPAVREQAVRQISGMFEWLVESRYLETNPWRALKLRQADDPTRLPRGSHAFTLKAWAALQTYLDHPDMNPAGSNLRARQRRAERDRMRFVLDFNEPCGLRAQELVDATVDHLTFEEAWGLHVHGKGSRNRQLELAPQALRALERYLRERGFSGLDGAPKGTHLLVQLMSESPLQYASFYEAFRDFVRDAIDASSLDDREKAQAKRASTHWLRHTTAVRLDERGADPTVIKDHLGHAHLDTTMKYLKSQEHRRRKQVHKAFA